MNTNIGSGVVDLTTNQDIGGQKNFADTLTQGNLSFNDNVTGFSGTVSTNNILTPSPVIGGWEYMAVTTASVQTITYTGSQSINIYFIAISGGAGGGSGNIRNTATFSLNGGKGGGGGSGQAQLGILTLITGDTLTLTVGAAGIGTTSVNTGGSGGITSIVQTRGVTTLVTVTCAASNGGRFAGAGVPNINGGGGAGGAGAGGSPVGGANGASSPSTANNGTAGTANTFTASGGGGGNGVGGSISGAGGSFISTMADNKSYTITGGSGGGIANGNSNYGSGGLGGIGTSNTTYGSGQNGIAGFGGAIMLYYTLSNFKATISGIFMRPRGLALATPVLAYNTVTNEVSYNTSSIKYKKNVIDLTEDTVAVYKLRAREYDAKSDDKHYIGYIAEEVNECSTNFSWKNSDGTPEGLEWFNILIYSIEELKKVRAKCFELEARILALEN